MTRSRSLPISAMPRQRCYLRRSIAIGSNPVDGSATEIGPSSWVGATGWVCPLFAPFDTTPSNAPPALPGPRGAGPESSGTRLGTLGEDSRGNLLRQGAPLDQAETRAPRLRSRNSGCGALAGMDCQPSNAANAGQEPHSLAAGSPCALKLTIRACAALRRLCGLRVSQSGIFCFFFAVYGLRIHAHPSVRQFASSAAIIARWLAVKCRRSRFLVAIKASGVPHSPVHSMICGSISSSLHALRRFGHRAAGPCSNRSGPAGRFSRCPPRAPGTHRPYSRIRRRLDDSRSRSWCAPSLAIEPAQPPRPQDSRRES
jgi:hypothetical protein